MEAARTPAQRYGVAVLVIAATLIIRTLMAPLWETTAPFALFMFATVVAAWFAGTGPALLTGAAGFCTRLYFDSPGEGGLLRLSWEEAVRLTLFAGFIGGMAVVLERMKADRRQLQQSILAAEAEIEERRRVEETLVAARAEAEEANRLKDEFLAMLSHELRTPLNAILGWVSLLRAGNLSAPRAAHAVDVIERNARLQAELVADLLDVARSLTGRLHVAPATKVNLAEVLVAAVDAARAAAEAKPLALVIDNVPAGNVIVRGEPARLQQIAAKLIANAIKFTPAGGRVSVSLGSRDGFAELVVSDTGVGIPPEFLPHVFERFTQAETGSTRRHGGLGLGLAIVRQLVELHDGHIEAGSDGAGRGARFTVRLPLLAATGDDRERRASEVPADGPAHVRDAARPTRRASSGGT